MYVLRDPLAIIMPGKGGAVRMGTRIVGIGWFYSAKKLDHARESFEEPWKVD